MNSLRGRDCWPLLRIHDALLEELRAKHAAGAEPGDLIDWLQQQSVTKPGAILALKLTHAMPPSEIKLAVHLHPAYAYRREADEAFEKSVVAAVEELNHSEAA